MGGGKRGEMKKGVQVVCRHGASGWEGVDGCGRVLWDTSR